MSGREKTPRRTTRRTSATPVRDVSPPAHSTRAVSTAIDGTPGTRRSTRAITQRANQPNNAMNNSALPEIQTRQSYAYGSSKTPLLPEQLHVRDSLTMKQVADQMTNAINQAGQNLNTHAAELEESRQHQRGHAEPDGQQQKFRKGSKEPSPASVTTEVQKKQRTAQWAKSLENGPLQGIQEEIEEEEENDESEEEEEEVDEEGEDAEEEEEEVEVETPESRRTEPSSFPSGIFDHSYQYERGMRNARRPGITVKKSTTITTTTGSRLHGALDRIIATTTRFQEIVTKASWDLTQWLGRVFNSISKSFVELPDSPIFSVLTKSFIILSLIGMMSYFFCFTYTRLLCAPGSPSIISQTLSSICGTCRTTPTVPSYFNFTSNSQTDMTKITSALHQIDAQIRAIESRLTSQLNTKITTLTSDVESLRREQSMLFSQLEDMSSNPASLHQHQNQQSSHRSEIASPLLPKINYFSPANGAIINPDQTSPTRQPPISLHYRILSRLVGLKTYNSNGPMTALEPWQDVGECWCAAPSSPSHSPSLTSSSSSTTASRNHDIRLGISTHTRIFPTELILEHPPRSVCVTPETAPRKVELWADLGWMTLNQWRELDVDRLIPDPNEDGGVGSKGGNMKSTYALLATVEYDLNSTDSSTGTGVEIGMGVAAGNHVQKFNLDLNTSPEGFKYAATDYIVRIRSTYGGEFGCLYRVRLHGVPVVEERTRMG